MTCITCHQPRGLRAVSLFLQVLYGECTRARAAKPRNTRDEGGSHTCGNLRVSRFARRTTEKRETARSLSTSSPGLFPEKSPGDEVDLPSLKYFRGMSIRPLCKLGKNTLKRPNNQEQIFTDDVNIGICTHK